MKTMMAEVILEYYLFSKTIVEVPVEYDEDKHTPSWIECKIESALQKRYGKVGESQGLGWQSELTSRKDAYKRADNLSPRCRTNGYVICFEASEFLKEFAQNVVATAERTPCLALSVTKCCP